MASEERGAKLEGKEASLCLLVLRGSNIFPGPKFALPSDELVCPCGFCTAAHIARLVQHCLPCRSGADLQPPALRAVLRPRSPNDNKAAALPHRRTILDLSQSGKKVAPCHLVALPAHSLRPPKRQRTASPLLSLHWTRASRQDAPTSSRKDRLLVLLAGWQDQSASRPEAHRTGKEVCLGEQLGLGATRACPGR